MLRKLFTVLTALSLLLCLAGCIFWIRSYRSNESFAWNYKVVSTTFESGRGSIMFFELPNNGLDSFKHEVSPPLDLQRQNAEFFYLSGEAIGFGPFAHFAYRGAFDFRSRTFGHALLLPNWFFVMCTSGAPLLRFRKLLKRRKWAATKRCLRCGYDLRETPERCPECGRVPPRKP